MSSPEQAIGFATRFFGDGNDIKLESLPKEFREWLQPWLDDLDDLEHQPVVLPRRRRADLFWYGLATSSRQARSLREDLMSFVGPSYSDFTGQLANLDVADPVELAVKELTGGNAFCLRVLPNRVADARNALHLMRSTWMSRPSRGKIQTRPVGRLIRDFNMALMAIDADASDVLLAQLGSSGRLTAANLAFLKIQRLASLERWGELLEQPETQTIVQMRRPIAVTEALIRAIYQVEIARQETSLGRDGILSRFTSNVLPRYSQLFNSRSTMRSVEASRLFMMAAATGVPVRRDLAWEVLSDSSSDAAERAFLTELAGPLLTDHEPVLVADPAAEAGAAIQGGDFDRAMAILESLPASVLTVPMLLRCAYEQNSLGAAALAIRRMEELSERDRERILAQRACHAWWVALQLTLGASGASEIEEPPSDWVEWLDRLNRGGPFAGALEVAAVGCLEWRIQALVDDPTRVAACADALLASREAGAEAILRNATPYLVRFLRQSEGPLPALRPIYWNAILLIASDDRLGGSDLAVLLDLVVDVFGMGVSPSEYREIVGYLGETWAAAASPRHVDWCLDALDCLATYPARVGPARQAFVVAALRSFAPWARRLEEYQVKLLTALAVDLEATDLVELVVGMRDEVQTHDQTTRDAELARALSGRKVGIYTLTEAVGRHVRDVLLSIQDDVQVVLSHDKVGSDRLRRVAQEADIFLVAVRSATHAATMFIDANRPVTKTTILASGKGSASMLRSLFSYLDATARAEGLK